MVKKNNIKNLVHGFTLAEMMISMLVISIFFAASTKLITRKHPTETYKAPHGFYECYMWEGKMYSHSVKGQSDEGTHEAVKCEYSFPTGVPFLNIHYLDTSSGQFEGGTYLNSQETLYSKKLEIDNPSAIEDYYQFAYSKLTTPDEEGEELPEPEKPFYKVSQFKEFLKTAHPKSKILEIWNTVPEGAEPVINEETSEEEEPEGTPPSPALFISW